MDINAVRPSGLKCEFDMDTGIIKLKWDLMEETTKFYVESTGTYR